jgi:hypothetical protein
VRLHTATPTIPSSREVRYPWHPSLGPIVTVYKRFTNADIPSVGMVSTISEMTDRWTSRHRCPTRCRFSEARDPSFSKPIPPDLSTRLSASRAPLRCFSHPISVQTFASSTGRSHACRALGGDRGSADARDGCRRTPRRGAGHGVGLIASAPSRPWRAAARVAADRSRPR